MNKPHIHHTAHSLQDLKALKRQIEAQHKQALEKEKTRKKAAAQAQAERNLFVQSMGDVQPLNRNNRVHHKATAAAPIATQSLRDEQRVLQESISDDFDASSLLDTDDTLSYRQPGIGHDVIRRLRQGRWNIQAHMDLHGMRSDQARESLGEFLRSACRAGLRCVRIVHGKGLGSPGKTPILKGRVQGWLVQKKEVLAFVQARPVDGGAGALIVLLQAIPPKAAAAYRPKINPVA